MALAIVTSNTESKHRLLLTLNMLGVIACVCTMILLGLTALGLIFPEPYISPVILDHIRNFDNLAFINMRGNDFIHETLEDSFLFPLRQKDMLILFED